MNISKFSSPRSKKIIVRSKTVADIRNKFENFQKQSSSGESNKEKTPKRKLSDRCDTIANLPCTARVAVFPNISVEGSPSKRRKF